MLYVGIAIVALMVGFIWWRYTSVQRGMVQRNERILREIDPIGKALEKGEPVSKTEVERLAERPEIRLFLRNTLRQFNQLILFPERFNSTVAEGEALLCHWMMHPNELGDPPAEISVMKTFTRVIDGRAADFHVFRYRMAAGHWTKSPDLLGLAGPFFGDESPYERTAGAFSRVGDRAGTIDPEEIVDWYIKMAFSGRASTA